MRRWVALWLLVGAALHASTAALPLGTDEGGNSWIALHWASTSGSLYGRYWLDRPPALLVPYGIGAAFGAVGLRVVAGIAALTTSYVVYRFAERVAGARAARCAMPFAALTLSSAVIGSTRAAGELFAVLPGVTSVHLLLLARERSRSALWFGLSGALAALSVLTKQSFFDALVAGSAYFAAVFVLRVGRTTSARSWMRDAGSYALGALAPVALTLAWATTTPLGLDGLGYALFGFRVDALRALVHASKPVDARMLELAAAAVVSGMLFLLVCALVGLWRLRGDKVLVVTLTVWLSVAMFGVLGGGYYWPHYLIQLVPACALLTGVAIASWRRRFAGGVLAVIALVTIAAIPVSNLVANRSETLDVAGYLRANARPGDSLYVMYARANLVYYARMPTPYPYLWSSMLRAKRDAQPRLRAWLASRSCPVWIVQWQEPTSFGMDREGRTRALLDEHYSQVEVVRGVPILHRRGPCDAAG